MEFLHSFLRRHFAGKPVPDDGSEMSAIFSGYLIGKSQVYERHTNKILPRIKFFRKSRECLCEKRIVRPVLTYPMNNNVSAAR